MTDCKTQSAGQIEIPELMKINPLIDFDGDTSHVESVLGLFSFLILGAADGSLNLTYDQARGLAFTLDCCRTALEIMRNGEVHHGQ